MSLGFHTHHAHEGTYSAEPMPEVIVSRLEVETEQRPGEFWVLFSGEFDIQAFDEVDTMLADAQRNSDDRLIVDLRNLEFIDSTGIRALVRAHLRAKEQGKQFRLIRGSKNTQRVFDVTGLGGVLPFFDDDELSQS